MSDLKQLFTNNRAWADRISKQDPEFFPKLSRQQSPRYLWIGCADSRVPANEIVGLLPGEMFVHRNVANVVVHTDLNCLSVMQFAIDVLKVEHIIVVGHYGCSGVRAALQGDRIGIVDNWLGHIQDVREKHIAKLELLPDRSVWVDKLCEYNVLEQALNVTRTTVVRDAWDRGQSLTVHAWVYALTDGLVRDLDFTVNQPHESQDKYLAAISKASGSAI